MVAIIILLLLTVIAGSVVVGTVVADARRSGQELLPETSLVRIDALRERSEDVRARSHTLASSALSRPQSFGSSLLHAHAERRRDSQRATVA
ncbi:MAG: hypothetical protein ABI746_01425 [Dermatophilaceae bacterium]